MAITLMWSSSNLKPLLPEGLNVSSPTIAPIVEFKDKVSKKNRKGIGPGYATVTAVVEVNDAGKAGPQTAIVQLRYQACTDEYCLFPQKTKS